MDKRPQQIALASFLVSGLGLLFELLAFMNLPLGVSETIRYFSAFGYFIHLNVFDATWLTYYNQDSQMMANYPAIVCYAVLLIGSLVYVQSAYRETRLIRFAFAVFVGSAIVGSVHSILYVVLYLNDIMETSSKFIWILLHIVRSIGVLLLSFWVLKELKKTKTLSTFRNDAGEEILERTPKAQRFFHLIMDYVICILIFSGIGNVFIYKYESLRYAFDSLGDVTGYSLLLVVYRALYYFMFESILSASPAKYLTESRVLTLGGKDLSVGKAFVRTIVRFVPFEPLSFFGRGWHDTWSDTGVAKETRTGFSGAWYFLLIPVILFAVLGGSYGQKWYKERQRELSERDEHEARMAPYVYELDHLTSSHYVQIVDVNDRYAEDEIYLKVDSVYGAKADVVIFSVDGSARSLLFVTEWYHERHASLKKITVDIASLRAAVPMNYDDFIEQRDRGVNLLPGDKFYRVEKVFAEGAPFITESGSALGQGSNTVHVKNCGWPATVIAMKKIEGTTTFNTRLPYTFEGHDASSDGCCCGITFFHGADENTTASYKLEFILRDIHGSETTYVVEGESVAGVAMTGTVRRKL